MRALAATVVASALFVPGAQASEGVPPHPGYRACNGSQLEAIGFWSDLSVRKTSCGTGLAIARGWIRRVSTGDGGFAIPRGTVTVGKRVRYRCKFLTIQGETNPYGRVTCSRGNARVRFYGFS